MIKKLASHLGEYRRAAILTPMFSALEAVMDILLPTIKIGRASCRERV